MNNNRLHRFFALARNDTCTDRFEVSDFMSKSHQTGRASVLPQFNLPVVVELDFALQNDFFHH
jgi:hypothetical protein